MRLKVVYFATARDASGRKEESIILNGAHKVSDLAKRVRDIHPGLRTIEKSIRFAVNFEIADGNTLLHEGDEVGVLPAITGG